MKEIFEVAGAMIVSLGGGAGIVFGLSSWLGKVWANRILEKEKSELQKEIEDYRAKINKEFDYIKTINEKAVYISKVQYEKEFNIYQEIWEALNDCIVYTCALYPTWEDVPIDEKQREEYQKKKYSSYIEVYNLFARKIDRYAPFYKEEFYGNFIKVRNKCLEISNVFKRYEYDVKYSASMEFVRGAKMTNEEHIKVYTTIPNELVEIRDMLQKNIRNYLLSLQVVRE